MPVDDIHCHDNASFVGINGPTRWEKQPERSPYQHCSYCGSLHPDDVREVLKEGGKLGGADWKYGWAHKFYVYEKVGYGMWKFYNTHLNDMDDEELKDFAALLLTYTGIEFFREDGKLWHNAPYPGYQRG